MYQARHRLIFGILKNTYTYTCISFLAYQIFLNLCYDPRNLTISLGFTRLHFTSLHIKSYYVILISYGIITSPPLPSLPFPSSSRSFLFFIFHSHSPHISPRIPIPIPTPTPTLTPTITPTITSTLTPTSTSIGYFD